jgi:hypothetical protein
MSFIPGCGVVVRTMTVDMVWSAGVSSDAGVVVTGMVGVTTLHIQGLGDLKLPLRPMQHCPHRRNPRGQCAKMAIRYAPFL